MKSLRRSLNNDKEGKTSNSNPSQPSPPLPGSGPLSRPAASGKIAPPQKVIKAIRTHRSTNPQELSYQEGDFWYVTSERDGWYEALNPLTGSRGLVPKSDFDEFMKGGKAPSGVSQRSGSSDQIASSRSQTPSQGQFSPVSNPRSPPAHSASPPAIAGPPRKPVYAIVQYDFAAERPDELDAKKGEPIVVIAQSNHEWFVAKPIGRLGGPGLIPVAFVEIRDPATGRPIEVLPDTIPMVEEWKKATADYKAAAIPLGRFDFAPDQQHHQQPLQQAPQPPAGSAYAPSTRTGSSSQSQPHSQSQSQSSMPRSTSASSIGKVNGNSNGHGTPRREHYRPEEDALLPPGEMVALEVPSFHNESGSYWFRLQVLFHPDDRSVPAYALSLYRTYEDFYEFQINLLDTFPFEAGRPAPGKEDQSPPERILPYMPGPVEDAIDDELTEYRREELDAYVRALVDLKLRGAGYILRHELIRGFFAAKYGDHCQEAERQDAVEELDEGLANTRISDGRGQQPDLRAPSAMSRNSQKSSTTSGARQSGGYPSQGYPQSQSSHSRQASRGPSPMQAMAPIETSSSSSRNHAPQPQSSGSLNTPSPAYLSGPLSTATTSSSWGHPPNSAASSSVPPPPPPASGQPPYVKIKIYDRATDDLIAIRVHPNVTYDELYEKVHARLGSTVSALRYKDASMGGGGGYREIRDDEELRDWMRIEDQKLVLYAEQ